MRAELFQLFSRRERGQAIVLLLLMTGGAVLEVLGIGFVVPLVALLTDSDAALRQPVLRRAYELSGAKTAQEFGVHALAAFVALIFLKNAYLAALAVLQHRFVFRKQAELSRRLFDAYLTAPYALHLQRHSSDVARNLLTEVNALISGIVTPLLNLTSESMVLLLLLITLVLAVPGPTVVVIGVGAIVVTAIYLLLRAALDRFGAQRLALSSRRIRAIGDALGGLKEVKILGREHFFRDIFAAANGSYLEAARVFATLSTLPRMLIEVLAVALLVGATLFLVAAQNDMKSAVPGIVLLCLVALRLMPAATRILGSLTTIRYYRPSLYRLHEDLRQLTEHRPATETAKESGPGLRDLATGIVIEKLQYRYANAQQPAIDGISLEIPAGMLCGFVGASGAGKSTLADLLLGVLQAQGGRILADGVDIRTDMRGWQAMLGYVPQSIHLLDEPVRQNVAFGLRDDRIDDERVWAALRDAQLEALIRAHKDGLNARIGEQGTRLSGGQRQRLGIARALYSDPRVLLLDEATSALDVRTERAVAETLLAMRGSRTTIVIAHRLDTIRRCERLFFLENGKLLGSGTYDELVAGNVQFAALMGEATL